MSPLPSGDLQPAQKLNWIQWKPCGPAAPVQFRIWLHESEILAYLANHLAIYLVRNWDLVTVSDTSPDLI